LFKTHHKILISNEIFYRRNFAFVMSMKELFKNY